MPKYNISLTATWDFYDIEADSQEAAEEYVVGLDWNADGFYAGLESVETEEVPDDEDEEEE